ncbi:thioredoxin domain-containing protein [Acinetobacter sp. CUI P1]|nr:thioredoxin domain-containing protein [Acinetobacter sp. CUI P1]
MKANNKNLVIYTTIIVVLLVALFVINQASKKNTDITKATSKSSSTSSQPLMGDTNAKVSIVEFGDYKCPSCKAWGEQVWPKLKASYVDTGKATFSYINVLFHGTESNLGALAGEAVLKTNPDDFWNFHKTLFDAQPSENHDGLWITEEKLLDVVQTSVPGIDKEHFKKT